MGRETRERLREIDAETRQHHQLIFETFKHFTTLDTAAALVVVGLYRYLELPPGALVSALLSFGFSLALCAWGMLQVALGGISTTKAKSQAAALLLFGVIAFFLGLYWSVFNIVWG